jgi:hypothetical protein
LGQLQQSTACAFVNRKLQSAGDGTLGRACSSFQILLSMTQHCAFFLTSLKIPCCVCRPDYDFGQAPMIINAFKKDKKPNNGNNKYKSCKKTVVAGQKSGWVWSLNAANGKVCVHLQLQIILLDLKILSLKV